MPIVPQSPLFINNSIDLIFISFRLSSNYVISLQLSYISMNSLVYTTSILLFIKLTI